MRNECVVVGMLLIKSSSIGFVKELQGTQVIDRGGDTTTTTLFLLASPPPCHCSSALPHPPVNTGNVLHLYAPPPPPTPDPWPCVTFPTSVVVSTL